MSTTDHHAFSIAAWLDGRGFFVVALVTPLRPLPFFHFWLHRGVEIVNLHLADLSRVTGLAARWRDDMPGACSPIEGTITGRCSPLPADPKVRWGSLQLAAWPLAEEHLFQVALVGPDEVLPIATIYRRDAVERSFEHRGAILGLPWFIAEEPVTPNGLISRAEQKRLFGVMSRLGVKPEQLKDALEARWGIASSKAITRDRLNLVIHDMLPAIAAGEQPLVTLEPPAPAAVAGPEELTERERAEAHEQDLPVDEAPPDEPPSGTLEDFPMPEGFGPTFEDDGDAMARELGLLDDAPPDPLPPREKKKRTPKPTAKKENQP